MKEATFDPRNVFLMSDRMGLTNVFTELKITKYGGWVRACVRCWEILAKEPGSEMQSKNTRRKRLHSL